jgi:hypothetical protein
MLYSFITEILSLQIKHKAFPFIETQIYSLSTFLEKFRVYFMLFFIKTLYEVFLFNLAQLSLIIGNPKQLLLEKYTHYLHLEHYTPRNRTHISFQRNCCSSIQDQTKVNWIVSTVHIRKTLTSTVVGMKLYCRYTFSSVINIT